MTPPDPARIAAGLTPKVAAALMRFPGPHEDVPEPTGAEGYAWTTLAYWPTLIARDPVFLRATLTPLVRAVRAALADAPAVAATRDDGDRT